MILLGVRQCGKTTLCKSLRPDWQYFDLERSRDYDLITQDIDFFFKEYPHSLIIDEAQHFPQLFQELRGIIDARRNWKKPIYFNGIQLFGIGEKRVRIPGRAFRACGIGDFQNQ